ncbi:hypothetical protein B0H67DRAFT_572374 [Lasiosphaeris hirsuta]|uniref:Alpha-type protein kinase domain-containing protein n=1 Tax=Lasiosphaeris hirsuta TaxID=260670 RepID=A0AA40E8A5_9PEZI|nr:hypothetical protein B0H67DRAFT_572374 [Lasiosphaeris hirsuta]
MASTNPAPASGSGSGETYNDNGTANGPALAASSLFGPPPPPPSSSSLSSSRSISAHSDRSTSSSITLTSNPPAPPSIPSSASTSTLGSGGIVHVSPGEVPTSRNGGSSWYRRLGFRSRLASAIRLPSHSSRSTLSSADSENAQERHQRGQGSGPGRPVYLGQETTAGPSAIEAELRVAQLKEESVSANAAAPARSTDGLFAAACSTDLLFLIDTTGSMGSYIDAAKNQMKSIVDDITDAFFKEADLRIGVVSYKDHGDAGHLQHLDFTGDADQVRAFIADLRASGGNDLPEDVLGGLRQALNLSWTHQSRLIIHITDAPPHGRHLHDLDSDTYPRAGAEPHHLTHEPLLKQLVRLNINYALLRINSSTDRMAYNWLQAYAVASPDCKLLPTNRFHAQAAEVSEAFHGAGAGPGRRRGGIKAPQFEENELGTAYSALRHLVVKSVTTSASRTASRIMSMSSGTVSPSSSSSSLTAPVPYKPVTAAARATKAKVLRKLGLELTAIKEDNLLNELDEEDDNGDGDVAVETAPPRWAVPGWLNTTLRVEAFSTAPPPALAPAPAPATLTLDAMMDSDAAIAITTTDLTLHKRSQPFAQGAMRTASYARTAASTSRLVVKSFKRDGGKALAHLADDMRVQALCKAFALEFNAFSGSPPLDFVVATCLKPKFASSGSGSGSGEGGCMSLEPFLEGAYVKYNNNSGYAAQAFSHFTFERSRGRFLVADLQGVGGVLTDPAVHTRDRERFKLADTNLGEAGFKFFFATHACNAVCARLGLKSEGGMMAVGEWAWRESWELPADREVMVCCANKMCGRIVTEGEARRAEGEEEWKGWSWCQTCWPQLAAFAVKAACAAEGPPPHEFDVSRFFYESQAQTVPDKCPQHRGSNDDVQLGYDGAVSFQALD